VGSADVENIDPLKIRHFDDFRTVGSDELTRAAGRFASRMRLELIRSAVFEEGLGPRLERRFSSRRLIGWSPEPATAGTTTSLSICSLTGAACSGILEIRGLRVRCRIERKAAATGPPGSLLVSSRPEAWMTIGPPRGRFCRHIGLIAAAATTASPLRLVPQKSLSGSTLRLSLCALWLWSLRAQ
jgi:hypothetical protein